MRISRFIHTISLVAFAIGSFISVAITGAAGFIFDALKAIAAPPINLMILPSVRSVSALFQLPALRSFAVRLSWRSSQPAGFAI